MRAYHQDYKLARARPCSDHPSTYLQRGYSARVGNLMTTVFIISKYLMFSHGLESLIGQETGLQVIGHEKDLNRAMEAMKELQPDVVIFDSSDPMDDSGLTVMHILNLNPDIRVISLSLQSNRLYIYQARQSVANSIEDLVQAIENDPTFGTRSEPGRPGVDWVGGR